MAMAALSPWRLPSLMILTYPPGRSPTFMATSRNNSETAYLFLKLLNTTLRLCVVSFFDLVIRGSTYCLSALAFASVVLMRLCSIKEQAIFANIDFLCAVFLLK